ncbi:hypothetical protein SCLCIDRAFT_1048935 [Scleroderma citrinum Foug A]|uniref:Uncharacterized protein n=1 Tax=Scleroderma citrinum Foug A TaxID=1036808 RepID=A0A0C3DS91_9AGAM|nr:hypothetical protein SCLCIDRAFT_1048935 [Scleroderma citrinum Foug A]
MNGHQTTNGCFVLTPPITPCDLWRSPTSGDHGEGLHGARYVTMSRKGRLGRSFQGGAYYGTDRVRIDPLPGLGKASSKHRFKITEFPTSRVAKNMTQAHRYRVT